jgi:glycosyltransferase involved in cell wall biosynthesis
LQRKKVVQTVSSLNERLTVPYEKQLVTLTLEERDFLHQIRLSGFVPREEMPEMYATADIFVLPSFNEGMSVALLEAMASSLPVVVTPTGGTDELLNGNGLLVPWADAVALADALGRLIGSPELRAAQGQQNRVLALKRTWPDTAQATLDLCRRVATGGGN